MIPRMMRVAMCGGALALAPIQSGNLSPQQLPVYGGSGGTAFSRSCGAGKVLTGLRFRAGLFLDAVGLLCRPVNASGTLGPETTVGTLAGGGGGDSGSRSCKSGTVLTRVGIYVGSYVNTIFLSCRTWNATTRKVEGPHQGASALSGRNVGTEHVEQCEASTQPMKSIRGRAAGLVDAIGFTCDEP